MTHVSAAIRNALLTGEARAKVMAARKVARDWRLGRLASAGPFVAMPASPAWPARLVRQAPGTMPRRGRYGSERSQIALWHALAHIEFVAIDLALDMAGRFGGARGAAFVSDWLIVTAEEAMHFALIERKLAAYGVAYGDLPVHDGLWQAASETAHDVAARLAIVPMVLEARGLDVTPTTLERVRAAGDAGGARILGRILDDEVRHVGCGTRHFRAIAKERGESPSKLWRKLVETHFSGRVKGPFNDSARQAAGLSREFYGELA